MAICIRTIAVLPNGIGHWGGCLGSSASPYVIVEVKFHMSRRSCGNRRSCHRCCCGCRRGCRCGGGSRRCRGRSCHRLAHVAGGAARVADTVERVLTGRAAAAACRAVRALYWASAGALVFAYAACTLHPRESSAREEQETKCDARARGAHCKREHFDHL